MKRIGEIAEALRSALNEQRSYISAEEISSAVFQASNTVFGHRRGHPALYRPGQPVPPQGYQLTEVIDMALHPFLQVQRYVKSFPGQGELPLGPEGVLLFPRKLDPNTGLPTDENYFQYPTALYLAGAQQWRKPNDNALQQMLANSLTAPTLKQPVYVSVPGGFKLFPDTIEVVDLQFLAAPPRCMFAEKADPDNEFERIYDDDNSIDIGWEDVTAINEIIAHATKTLGGQVKDQQAVNQATQTSQLGA
jgi:hypothetical protein